MYDKIEKSILRGCYLYCNYGTQGCHIASHDRKNRFTGGIDGLFTRFPCGIDQASSDLDYQIHLH